MLLYYDYLKKSNVSLLLSTAIIIIIGGPSLSCSAFLNHPFPSHHHVVDRPSDLSSLSATKSEKRSIWASSEWKFTFNLGREPGTLMDENWGASGGRLIFDLPLEVSSDATRGSDKEDPMLQRNGCQLIPLSDTTYTIGEEKQSSASFSPRSGEWKIQIPRGESNGGKAGKLMCYVDLETPLQKNDIRLEKGERIYLTAKCWRENELDIALKRLRPFQQEYRLREQKLEQADPKEYYGYERLIIDRDLALGEYQDANIYYPTINDDDPTFSWTASQLEWQEGPWPGELEWLTIEPLFLMVRRTKFFINEEYHVIGTWAASPIISGDSTSDDDDDDDDDELGLEPAAADEEEE